MNSIHITFILCCLCYCAHSNVDAQSLRQPTKLRSISTTTTTGTPLASDKYLRQTRRSHETAHNGNINESKSTYPLLGNNTIDVGEDVENGDHAKEFDHKHRVLLAVESDLKYRDRAKQQEKVQSMHSQNNMPDTRKRLKDGLKDLLSKLHPIQPSADPMLQKSTPVKEIVSRPTKSWKPTTNKSKKQQRRTYIRTLKCEDIPHSEALLHSGLLNDLNNLKHTTQNPVVSQPAENIKNVYEMRRNRLKPRRNQMKFFPTYHNYPPISWSHNPLTYNRFNFHNPHNLYDCNYFLDTVSDAGVPNVQYVWEDYDYDEGYNNYDTMVFSNDKVKAKKLDYDVNEEK